MAFTFAAFCYMLSLVLCAALIFFAIWHVSTRRRLLTLSFCLARAPVHLLLRFLLKCHLARSTSRVRTPGTGHVQVRPSVASCPEAGVRPRRPGHRPEAEGPLAPGARPPCRALAEVLGLGSGGDSPVPRYSPRPLLSCPQGEREALGRSPGN